MELTPTNDIIKALEGELVYIKTSDSYELLDQYSINDDILFMQNNKCSVKATDISSIRWINDHKDYDKEKTFYSMIDSTREH